MNTPYCIVFCTCPDHASAEQMAQQLTALSLVACTNIIPHLTSIYFWEGKVTQGNEVMMVMKTHQDKLVDLEKAILEVHPYEFPEFIAIPIIYGNAKYLNWVQSVVKPGS